MWIPKSYEEHLLKQYVDLTPGLLFLEVSVGFSCGPNQARRIDGVLIPGEEKAIYPQGTYSSEQLREMANSRRIHLLEAKSKLNRALIGQILVGESLLKQVFDPTEVIKVAICGEGNLDLEWFCRQNEIMVTLFPQVKTQKSPRNADNESQVLKTCEDYRQPPNADKFRAFLAGWTDAVKGRLYASVYYKKTHANMGNLFGWIYGEQTKEFRRAIWEHYLIHANKEWQKMNLGKTLLMK